MCALSDLEAGTGTVTSERAVLFGVSTTQEVTFKTFLIGKMVAEGAVMTVPEAERVLLRASEFLKCPGAMCSFAMLKENLTNKLLSIITVVQSDFYNKRCVGITVTRGKYENKLYSQAFKLLTHTAILYVRTK